MSAPGEPPASGGPLRRSLRLYEQVVRQLVTWADASGLGPVDQLPPERDLAVRLGVSRATLAPALVALEVTGVVSVATATAPCCSARRAPRRCSRRCARRGLRPGQVRSSQPPEGVTTAVTRWSCGSTGSSSTSSSSKTRATSRASGRTCRSARS